MKNRRNMIIAAAVSVVLILGVYLVMVRGKSSEVSTAQQQLTTLEQEESSLRTELAAKEALAEEIPALQRQLDEAESLIPQQADTPGLIRLLRLVADKTGCDFAVLQQGTPNTDDAGFSSIEVQIEVTGRLDQVAQYLWEIEHLERAIKIPSLDLSPLDDGRVAASLNAQTFTTDMDSGPGSIPGSQANVEEEA